jgi:hypothetical protein
MLGFMLLGMELERLGARGGEEEGGGGEAERSLGVLTDRPAEAELPRLRFR